jgi:hypothetical protein
MGEQLAYWKVITLLIGVISAGVIYWRRQKDRKDDELTKDIVATKKESKEGRAAIYHRIDENQQKVMSKLDEVLAGQHSFDLKLERASSGIEQNAAKIEDIAKKQDKSLDDLRQVEKKQAVEEEWKKRVEDKLSM